MESESSFKYFNGETFLLILFKINIYLLCRRMQGINEIEY
jgi:hypothetical protein